MSLINDMLKDLEERGSTRGSAVRATPPARSSATARGALVALAVLVVLLAGMIAWLLRPVASVVAQPVVAVQQAPAPVTAPAETPTTASATEAEPVAIELPDETVLAATPLTTPDEPEAKPVPESVPEPVHATPVVEEEKTADSVIVRRHQPTAAEKAVRAGRDGFTALRLGDWANAARLLGELVLLEPANDEAREGLAVALANQGRIAESESVLLDGIAVGAVPARFAKLRARLKAARGELDAALDSLSVAVPDAARDPEFHALKAALAQQAGRHETAAETYAVLTALDPANGTWQAGLGMARDALGDATAALVAYERAFEAGGLDPALRAHVESRLAALKD